MDYFKKSVEGVTGTLGIGALHILGLFFILDGKMNFLSFIEQYSKTASWEIFVTIPMIVISYILGILSIITSEIIFYPIYIRSIDIDKIFIKIINSKNNYLIQKYQEIDDYKKILGGSALSFITLSFGSLSEIRMMGEFNLVGYLGFIFAIIASILCVFLSTKIIKKIDILYKASLQK